MKYEKSILQAKTPFYSAFLSLCQQKGVSPSTAAKEADISSGAPTAWKNGAVPKPAQRAKLCRYFGVSDEQLLGYEQKEKAPTSEGERQISDDDLKFALWGGTDDIDDDDLEDVRNYAAFVRERKKRQNK